MNTIPLAQLFTFFFVMLGPLKIIGPFARLTQGADTKLVRQIALKATIVSILSLVFTALLGDRFLTRYGVPLPTLALAAGIILFLVALQNVLHKFSPPPKEKEDPAAPTLKMAVTPLAFPTIVTPYGIAVLIVALALSPDMDYHIAMGKMLAGIMLLNFVAMLLARYILRYAGLALHLLEAVLGIIQVALGLQIIQIALRRMWAA